MRTLSWRSRRQVFSSVPSLPLDYNWGFQPSKRYMGLRTKI
nr:MAG TPA: hypothetical protein [Caudoviricetes sp.]